MSGKKSPIDEIPHERDEPRPDFSKPLPRKPLPKSLQSTLDNEEKLWETIYEEQPHNDSTESNVRYAAYASRFRTILISAQRYVAYTSDIGESFRPVAHPNWVRAAYGVSWAYLAGDVGYEGFKAYKRNQAILNPMGALASHKHKGEQLEDKNIDSRAEHLQPGKVAPIDDYRTVMAQRAIFQSVASMGLPAFTIHSVVRYSGRALKNAKNTMVRTWAPIGLGLAVVPFLPYLFDKPVEHVVEYVFHKGFELTLGPESVHGSKPSADAAAKQLEMKKEL